MSCWIVGWTRGCCYFAPDISQPLLLDLSADESATSMDSGKRSTRDQRL
jgi:hypothetical protein